MVSRRAPFSTLLWIALPFDSPAITPKPTIPILDPSIRISNRLARIRHATRGLGVARMSGHGLLSRR
jgi:hypothetical protein